MIIPVYNVAPYLRECLDSLLKQTCAEWEAICVDDGSTDASGAILDEYAAKDARIRVIHQMNAGVGSARNVALDRAKGGWYLFLDGDDVFLPDAMSVVRRAISTQKEVKLFRFRHSEFTGDFDIRQFKRCSDSVTWRYLDVSKKLEIKDLHRYVFEYAYSRQLFQNLRFPPYRRGEDRCVTCRIHLERVNRILTTNCVLYGYRMRPGSAMSTTPTLPIIRDEMAHRFDIMTMIDASPKDISYSGDRWIEKYFTQQVYGFARRLDGCKYDVLLIWRLYLNRVRTVKGLSFYGRFVVWSCSLIPFVGWNEIVCYLIPRLRSFAASFTCCRKNRFSDGHGFVKSTTTKELVQFYEDINEDRTALSKAHRDAQIIASRCGFVNFKIKRRSGDNRWSSIHSKMAWVFHAVGVIFRIQRDSIAFIQFPSPFLDGRLGLFFLRVARTIKHVKYITLLHDINLLRRHATKFDLYSWNVIKNVSDVIVSHNEQMSKWLRHHGVEETPLLNLRVFDYLTDDIRSNVGNRFSLIVTIAGNLGINQKSSYVQHLAEIADVEWWLYGPGFDNNRFGSRNIVYHGSFTPEDIPDHLSCGFGLVWDGASAETCDGLDGDYLRYNNPHKFSLYISAGLPVIVWKDSALRHFVETADIGFSINSLKDIVEKFHTITENDYERFKTNIRRIQPKVQSGEFLATALRNALDILEDTCQ